MQHDMSTFDFDGWGGGSVWFDIAPADRREARHFRLVVSATHGDANVSVGNLHLFSVPPTLRGFEVGKAVGTFRSTVASGGDGWHAAEGEVLTPSAMRISGLTVAQQGAPSMPSYAVRVHVDGEVVAELDVVCNWQEDGAVLLTPSRSVVEAESIEHHWPLCGHLGDRVAAR